MAYGRHRSITMRDEWVPYAQQAAYTTVEGNCTSPPSTTWSNWNINNHSGTSQTDYDVTTMDDVVTPNFKKLVAEGKIINNPLLKTRIQLADPVLGVSIYYDIKRQGCSPVRYYDWRTHRALGTRSMSSMFGANLFLAADSVDLTHQKDLAITKAWSNIDHGEILSLSALKELNSTVAGLLYILKKVYKISRAVRRMEVKTLKKELKPSELEQVYMNARYNLRPLYYDTKALIKIFRSETDKPGRQTFRSLAEVKSSKSDIIQQNIYSHDMYVNVVTDLHRSTSTVGIVRAGVLTESGRVTSPQIWGLDSIVLSAWDLLPYSFIVDWFANVGDTIASWTPNFGIKTLASWVTANTIVTQKSTIGARTVTINDGNGYYFHNPSVNIGLGSATKITTITERIPNYSRPIIPSWNLNLDCGKIFDLGIILRNLTKYRRLTG